MYEVANQKYEKDLAAFLSAGGEMKARKSRKDKKVETTNDPNKLMYPAGVEADQPSFLDIGSAGDATVALLCEEMRCHFNAHEWKLPNSRAGMAGSKLRYAWDKVLRRRSGEGVWRDETQLDAKSAALVDALLADLHRHQMADLHCHQSGDTVRICEEMRCHFKAHEWKLPNSNAGMAAAKLRRRWDKVLRCRSGEGVGRDEKPLLDAKSAALVDALLADLHRHQMADMHRHQSGDTVRICEEMRCHFKAHEWKLPNSSAGVAAAKLRRRWDKVLRRRSGEGVGRDEKQLDAKSAALVDELLADLHRHQSGDTVRLCEEMRCHFNAHEWKLPSSRDGSAANKLRHRWDNVLRRRSGEGVGRDEKQLDAKSAALVDALLADLHRHQSGDTVRLCEEMRCHFNAHEWKLPNSCAGLAAAKLRKRWDNVLRRRSGEGTRRT